MKIHNIYISNDLPFILIAGPCAIEGLDHALFHAEKIKSICNELHIPLIYKSSFDKANRTSLESERGVGIEEGLKILEKVKFTFDLPVITDVHENIHCSIVSEIVDVIQIPAFLCRQTDLLISAAKTGCAINIKKGQFLAPWDIHEVVKKVEISGNKKILITERGTSFGYNTLVSDMRSIPEMATTGYPVIFDATHSVQTPAGKGSSSGGERKYVETLSKAAIAVGVAGLFIETHQDPESALSDGPNMIPQEHLKSLLILLKRYDEITKSK